MFKQLRPALGVTAGAEPGHRRGLSAAGHRYRPTGVPEQANGSLLRDAEGKVLGSRLIAQKFDGEEWFHSRPSAGDYATVSSAASNPPSNPALAERIAREPRRSVSPTRGRCRWRWSLPPVADSIRSCRRRPRVTQALRVATARGLPLRLVEDLVESHTERPLVGAGGGQRAGAEHGAGGVEAPGFPQRPT